MSSFSIQYIYEIIDKYNPVVKKILRNTKKFKQSIKSASTSVKKMSKSLKTMSKNLKDTGKKMADVGSKMTARLTLPLAALGTAGVIVFKDMEKGYENILTLLEEKEIKKYASEIKKLQKDSIRLGFSIGDTNKSLFDTVSALGAGKQAFKSFRVGQRLAIAGVTDLGIAIDGITSIVNAYGKETTDALEVANSLFSAQVKGKTTVAGLSSVIGRVAPVAKASGLGFKELLATVSGLTLGGLKTDEAVVALKGTLTALTNTSGISAKILKKLGVPVGIMEVRTAGLGKTLFILNEQFTKNPNLVRQAIPNIRAFLGITALSKDKLIIVQETLEKINKDIKNGTGLNAGYNRQLRTMDIKLKQLGGAFKILLESFIKIAAPSIKGIVGGMTTFFDKLATSHPFIKSIIIFFGTLLAVAGPIVFIMGQLTMAVIALQLVSWPLVGVIAAVVAIVIGVIAILLKWKEIVWTVINVFEYLINVLKKVAKFFIFPFLAPGIKLLRQGLDLIKSMIPDFVKFSEAIFAPITMGINAIKQSIDLVKSVKLGSVKNKVGDFFGNIKNKFSGNVDINVNAPRGAVKSISSQSSSNNFRLGTNMGM